MMIFDVGIHLLKTVVITVHIFTQDKIRYRRYHNIYVYNMLHQLRKKELIRKKIIYLKERIKDPENPNPLLETILQEYQHLQNHQQERIKY